MFGICSYWSISARKIGLELSTILKEGEENVSGLLDGLIFLHSSLGQCWVQDAARVHLPIKTFFGGKICGTFNHGEASRCIKMTKASVLI